METSLRYVALLKALSPIEEMVVGIITLVMELQDRKALLTMEVSVRCMVMTALLPHVLQSPHGYRYMDGLTVVAIEGMMVEGVNVGETEGLFDGVTVGLVVGL